MVSTGCLHVCRYLRELASTNISVVPPFTLEAELHLHLGTGRLAPQHTPGFLVPRFISSLVDMVVVMEIFKEHWSHISTDT